MNRAFYGDIHGCIDELKELHALVEKAYPGIEHWHLGDLVDRGPDSGACVQFAMDNFAGGVMGNHESTIIKGYHACKRNNSTHKNPDKAKTIATLNDERVRYLEGLPYLHVFDDVGLVLAHGGVYPKLPFYRQPPLGVCRLQMIKPGHGMMTAKNRWWGGDSVHQPKVGKTEAESREEGYVRWYEAYDHQYDCIYGHSVMGIEPYIHQNEGAGRTIGIDTGSCFGGYLTALIYPEMKVIRVLCEEYVEGKNVKRFKGMVWENPANK